jgi:SAM-dependent methyltransferase
VCAAARQSSRSGIWSIAFAPGAAVSLLAENARVATYAHFARHYDALMAGPGGGADPLANAARISGYLARHLPQARSLLELGCGTGAVLAGLSRVPSLTGLDRSPQMLARARATLPEARFVRAGMTAFELGERFDAVICVFDTVNHLPRFELWQALFERAAEHLHDGGLFAFDVNTVGQLRRLAAAGPWLNELPHALVTQEVEARAGSSFIWHVRIREAGGEHHERIGELGVELARIGAALGRWFTLLESAGDGGSPPTDKSERAYFAYRRRPRDQTGG